MASAEQGAGCWLRPVVLAAMLAGLTAGCGLFSGAGGGEAEPRGETLDQALASLVPLPYAAAPGEGVSEADIEASKVALEAADGTRGDAPQFSAKGDPLLRPGLALRIGVMVGEKREVDEPRVQITDKGDVTLPLVGKIACAGQSLLQFKTTLTEAFGGFMRNPEVTVDFVYDDQLESPWGRVLVLGQVKNPGPINMPPTRDVTVSRAIQMAGGYGFSAKKGAIIVWRQAADGTKSRIDVDMGAIGRRGEIDKDIRLQAGDVVYVPERSY